MPNPAIKPTPAQQPDILIASTGLLLVAQHGGIIEFRCLVVRGQGLVGGLTVNSAQTLSRIARLLIEFLPQIHRFPSELIEPLSQSTRQIWQSFGSKQNQDDREN